MFWKTDKGFFFWIVFGLLMVTISGCNTSASGENSLAMLPLGQLPAEVQSAPLTVRQAYQFAAANPEILQQIPCYCGCGDIGHTSNYDCYVSNVDEQGIITFDNHSLGCSICVDITRDTMRLMEGGLSIPEIKDYIEETYGKYGVSNIP